MEGEHGSGTYLFPSPFGEVKLESHEEEGVLTLSFKVSIPFRGSEVGKKLLLDR
jgi:hypothetical protein